MKIRQFFPEKGENNGNAWDERLYGETGIYLRKRIDPQIRRNTIGKNESNFVSRL